MSSILDPAAATTGTAPASSSSKSLISKDHLQEDLNRFLNLLVTQLKNQDPLSPMDTNQFTSQLVAFAGVEQQINTNSNLEKMLAIQHTSQVSSVVGFLGTIVQAKGDSFNLENDFAAITYSLPSNSVKTTITIQNAQGKTVLTTDGETKTGAHGFTWDGKGTGGIKQPPGVYRAIISAKDPDGKALSIEQTVFGRVTGGGLASDGTAQLFMGNVEVPLDDVISVNAPAAASNTGDTSTGAT